MSTNSEEKIMKILNDINKWLKENNYRLMEDYGLSYYRVGDFEGDDDIIIWETRIIVVSKYNEQLKDLLETKKFKLDYDYMGNGSFRVPNELYEDDFDDLPFFADMASAETQYKMMILSKLIEL